MESIRGVGRGSLVAVVVAFMTLTGCSTATPARSHQSAHASNARAADSTASTYTIEYTGSGFLYKDEPAGYAVTFPQRPDVQPLENNETDNVANYASAELESGELVSIGQVIDKTPNLQAQLMGVVSSLNPAGQVSASSYTLGELDAVTAQFTTGSSPTITDDLVGQPAEIVVAGDGDHFYELFAIGGTPDERRAFFDSFTRTGN